MPAGPTQRPQPCLLFPSQTDNPGGYIALLMASLKCKRIFWAVAHLLCSWWQVFTEVLPSTVQGSGDASLVAGLQVYWPECSTLHLKQRL